MTVARLLEPQHRHNLYADGGFETYTGGTPSGWTIDGPSILTAETVNVRTGSTALKITSATVAPDGDGIFKNIVGTVAGKSYLVEVWAMRGASGDTPYTIIYNATDGVELRRMDFSAAATYQKLIVTFKAVAGKTYRLYLRVDQTGTSGHIGYFDGVTVREIVAADVSGALVSDGVNRVTNGGFETYPSSPGAPSSWTNFGGNASQFTKETTIIRSGSNSLKTTADGSTPFPRVFQTIPVVAGRTYLAEAWMRTDGLGTSTPMFFVRDSNNVDIENDSPAGGTTFQRRAISFTAAPGLTYQVHTGKTNGTAGSTYFDDVAVYEMMPPTSGGNHGTLSGGTNSPGPTPGSTGPTAAWSVYDFDGSNDYIDLGAPSALTTTPASGQFSISAWILADVASTNVIVRYGDAAAGWCLRISGGFLQGWVSDGTSTFAATDPGAIATGAWVHAIIAYDGANVKLWKNGVNVATRAFSGPLSFSNAFNGINIGRVSSGIEFFDGQMGHIGFYNRALVQTDIDYLWGMFSSGRMPEVVIPGESTQSCVLYLPLDEPGLLHPARRL